MRWPNPFEPPAALIDEVRSLIPPNPLFIVSWYCVRLRGLLQATYNLLEPRTVSAYIQLFNTLKLSPLP